MKRILVTLAFIVALAGGTVLLAGSQAGSCCDPTCCDSHKDGAAASCAKTEQVTSARSCNTE